MTKPNILPLDRLSSDPAPPSIKDRVNSKLESIGRRPSDSNIKFSREDERKYGRRKVGVTAGAIAGVVAIAALAWANMNSSKNAGDFRDRVVACTENLTPGEAGDDLKISFDPVNEQLMTDNPFVVKPLQACSTAGGDLARAERGLENMPGMVPASTQASAGQQTNS